MAVVVVIADVHQPLMGAFVLGILAHQAQKEVAHRLDTLQLQLAPSRPVQGLGRVFAIGVGAEDPLVGRQRPLVLGLLVVPFPDQQLGLRRLRLIGIGRDQLLKGRLRRRPFALCAWRLCPK